MPDPVPGECSAALASLLRDISLLAAGVALDRDTHPGRVLPVIDPRHLLRILPRVLKAAAELCAAHDPCPVAVECVEFMRLQARIIERGEGAKVRR